MSTKLPKITTISDGMIKATTFNSCRRQLVWERDDRGGGVSHSTNGLLNARQTADGMDSYKYCFIY